MNEFLFICETGEIVLADPTLHFCIGAGDMGDKRLYSTNDKTCSTTYVSFPLKISSTKEVDRFLIYFCFFRWVVSFL